MATDKIRNSEDSAFVDPATTWRVVLTADGSRTLRKTNSGITFHSTSGAVSESRQVFLENSRLVEQANACQRVSVLEIGFGTGLNFLLTADAARRYTFGLSYTAIDQHLVSSELLHELAYASALDDPSLIDQLIQAQQGIVDQPRSTIDFSGGIELQLVLTDACTQEFPKQHFHAIYLDPFGPDINPELWCFEFLQRLYESLVDDGRLVSYCVKSSVQRELREIGFEVSVRPGPPGGKRQVLVATRSS